MNHKTERDEALAKWQRECEGGSVPVTPMMRHAYRDGWDDALAGRSAGVPEGWELVPIEPTMEMVKAGSTSGGLGMDFHEWMGRIKVAWRHMIAAAPAPVSEPSPDREQATLCEDGGKCGIGGYCGQCEKVRAASDPEQPVEANVSIYVDCYECRECGHVGINDAHPTDAACGYPCGWSGPSPVEDKCPGCGKTNVMSSACPKCSGLYRMIAEADIASTAEQPKQSVPAPLSEYHEDTGPVVWWTWQDGLWLGEPAWIGAPTDSDWPGYHTHWTYHPEFPLPPLAVAAKLNEAPRRVTCSLTHEQISALYLHLLRRPRPEFGWMEAPLVAIESALMPVHGAIHDRGFNAMNRQFFGDDRFKFEERNITPNIEPAEQPSERGEQDCPHGVDDGACKQCYGEAASGEQGAALSDDVAMQLFTAAHAHSFFVFQRKANEILAASAPTLGGGDGEVAVRAKTVHRRIDALCEAANTAGADYFDASTSMLIATRDLLTALGFPHRMAAPQPQEAEPKGCPRCTSSTAAGCNDIGCGYLDSGSGEPNSAEPKGR